MAKNIIMVLAVIVAILAGWLVVQVSTMQSASSETEPQVVIRTVPSVNHSSDNLRTSLRIDNDEITTTLTVE